MEIVPFDSFDDMMEHLRREIDAANARVQPWQAAIRAGDYFSNSTPYRFSIYGEVLPEPDAREPHLRFYRFCKCHSIVCPGGEYGDVHVSIIERVLSKAAFEDARLRGWKA